MNILNFNTSTEKPKFANCRARALVDLHSSDQGSASQQLVKHPTKKKKSDMEVVVYDVENQSFPASVSNSSSGI